VDTTINHPAIDGMTCRITHSHGDAGGYFVLSRMNGSVAAVAAAAAAAALDT